MSPEVDGPKDQFWATALDHVREAKPETVRRWAVEWRAEWLRREARSEALQVERESTSEPVGDDGQPLQRVVTYRKRNPWVEQRKNADPEKSHWRVLQHAGFARTVIDALRKERLLGPLDERRPIPLDRWARLSPEIRRLTVRVYPLSPGIPRDSVEWIEYAETEIGQCAISALESRAKEEVERQARRDALINKVKLDAMIEWNEKLLGTEFALADGSRVTWRNATAEQHRARIEMLHVNAGANIEAAARHEAALAVLAESGAACLGEVDR